MITACNKGDRDDIQTMQNDFLRICNMSQNSDKISIEKLHEKCKMISLEQRRRKPLLRLMYLLSKDVKFLHVPGRLTRNANRITFKVPTRLNHIWERIWEKGPIGNFFHKLDSRETSLLNAANHFKIFLIEFEICLYERLYFLYIRNPLFPIAAFISMFWQLKVNMFYPKNSFPTV